jgi:hypothetical protein
MMSACKNMTPLMIAATFGQVQFIELLLLKGAIVDGRDAVRSHAARAHHVSGARPHTNNR